MYTCNILGKRTQMVAPGDKLLHMHVTLAYEKQIWSKLF